MYPKFEYFAEEDVDLFYEMCETFHQVHLLDSGRANIFNVNCHSICRALVMFYGIKMLSLCNGYVSAQQECPATKVLVNGKGIHSWLKTNAGSILDPYPIGIFSAVPLLTAHSGPESLFVTTRYVEDQSIVHDDDFDAKSIYRQAQYQVTRLEQATGKTRASSTWIS